MAGVLVQAGRMRRPRCGSPPLGATAAHRRCRFIGLSRTGCAPTGAGRRRWVGLSRLGRAPTGQGKSVGSRVVGAHPVGDRGASALPLRRLVAHRVRSYRAGRGRWVSVVRAHPAATAAHRCLRSAGISRTGCAPTAIGGAPVHMASLFYCRSQPVGDRGVSVPPPRRLIATGYRQGSLVQVDYGGYGQEIAIVRRRLTPPAGLGFARLLHRIVSRMMRSTVLTH